MTLSGKEIQAKKAELTAEGAFFETAPLEIEGRQLRGFKHAAGTVIELLNNARNHGDVDFVVYEGERYTFSSLFEAIDAMASQLQGDYEIEKGDRVAIAMRNNVEWMISCCAAVLVGAVVVPVNSWGKSEELQYALTDCGAKLLVCDEERYQLTDNALPENEIAIIVVPSSDAFSRPDIAALFDDVIAAGSGQSYTTPDIDPNDSVFILYTSGSTGFPKGVLHPHRTVGQAMMNMMFLGLLVAEFEGGPRQYRGGAERETPLLTVPLFHATGLISGLLMPMMLGQKVVMMYKWDSAKALELIEQERVTGLSSVPAILQDLLNHPDFERRDTSSLMRVSAAGAATPAGLPELIEAKIESPSRSAGYALTETMAVCSTMSGAIFDYKPDSSGVVSPIVEVRFIDPHGNEADPGEPGEIQLRSVCCTPGYWEKPEANAETFTADGWMKTGDLGMLDEEGFLHITGRIKEIVIRGGENIYPGEIEQAAFEIPEVREVVVFGEPDPHMGEELVMAIYPAPDSSLERSQVIDYLKTRLAGYKVPRTIVFHDSPLPRNASEKLHKLKVKEAYLRGLDQS